MWFSILHSDDLENLEELTSLKSQVEEIRLQDKLGKQNFHEDMKKLYELLTDTIKGTSRDITKTMKETSTKNKKLLESLNDTFFKK